MKKLFFLCLMALTMMSANADVQVKEKLNRAPVAVKTSQGILVSWRYLSADGDATFSVYRNGSLVKEGIADVTNYLDAAGSAGDTYKVVSSKGGEATCTAWDNMFTKISIPRPASRRTLVADKAGKYGYGRYRPDDISVGDVDGDGDYELIVKWFPDNQRDSGNDGLASAAYIDCYEMDGTQKWRIDVGDGVRSGNHTTQFLVYDFDGDGKAEVIFKTAPDSKDGKGNYVTQAGDATIKAIAPTTVQVNTNGRVTAGAEFLTVFNGETGEAMHTIFYSPSRSMVDFPNSDTSYKSSWGDSSYNRGERYNAAVAYLDGLNSLPTAIMQRGYYTACYIWAVDWDGSALKTRWLHKGTAKTTWSVVNASGTKLYDQDSNPVTSQGKSSYGQGVHGISVGDVDGDGKDDICIGAATIGSDGKLLCATGYGHGDAIHLAPLNPDRSGLQVMMPHEESPFGWDVHDSKTGEVLFSATSSEDNGRGLAADFIPAKRGFEFWSSADNIMRSCVDGTEVNSSKPDTNYRIYWTGDPYDQTFDGRYDETNGCAPRIRSWNTSSKKIITFQEFADYGKPQSCNTTKATPCLQADLMGDWREELIMINYEADWSASTCDLLIYSTPEPTKYKVPCLMEDHVYRMGIAWQNSSYNQPPHLGYYLPDYLGVDGNTYTTQTANHAPEKVIPPAPPTGEETVPKAGTDRNPVTGISYTTANNMVTDQGSGNYVKFRTGDNSNTWTFNVNEGYVITGIKVEGYSNNTLAEATISATSITVDGAEQLTSAHVFGPGSGNVSTITLTDLSAKEAIVFTFDNSNITSDAGKKNKQLQAIVTINYEKATAVQGIAEVVAKKSEAVKFLTNGKLIVLKDGKEFNAAGQILK